MPWYKIIAFARLRRASSVTGIAMLILIENGEVFDPAPRGRKSVLIANQQIEKVGAVDRRSLDSLNVPYEVIDATGCVVVPGLIDPHEHLLGSSGEGSLAKQSPMLFVDEICRAGVTTAVGALGVDTTMKTLPGLLARVKALKEEGLSTFLWTGASKFPPIAIPPDRRHAPMVLDGGVGHGSTAR